MGVLLEQDTDTGAAYLVLDPDAEVSRTVHLDDLVMVDVDDAGRPIGVELAMDCRNVSRDSLEAAWHLLVDNFWMLKEPFPGPESLLDLSSPASSR